MTTYIALLRGINVGGHNLVAMSALRDCCAALGLRGATTLLQSGNLVFQTEGRMGAALEEYLEQATSKRLKVTADYLVRSAKEWQKIIARNPFPKEAKKDPSHLVVMFLKSAPPADRVAALQSAIQGREIVREDGKQLYIVYPDGIGRSKLTGSLIEKKLDTRGTARNWNTMLKLAALAGH